MDHWQIYSTLGGVIAALAVYIKVLHAKKDYQIGKIAAAKDSIVADLTKRIDEIQEERVKFGEKLISKLQAAAAAARTEGDDDAS